MSVTAAASHEMIVSRWVDSFNARELDGILAHLAGNVEFHPQRLREIAGSYHGHEGVREWVSRLGRSCHEHRIVLHEKRQTGEGQVFASGSLSFAGSRTSDRAGRTIDSKAE